MNAESIFPFSAIVGQAAMKRALVLAAIHPGLGGVLIRGSKGAAKSTAVRALAALLPSIDVFEGDPFQRAPGEQVPGWPLPEGAQAIRRPVALVNLPVGATDDRVVGSLNLERALVSGQRTFEPGLLASAHRGILYIDEVNLLADHLVDLLLDAAAMGVNHVEREGLAFRHPARFVLVGTMNPEEGELRPQLLDRFGLVVEVEPMTDPRARAEVVRRRLAFDAEPERFGAEWAEADAAEGERIVQARARLPEVTVPEPVLESLCQRCASEGADGLRADLTIYRAASALAAYEGRTSVTEADVEEVAELALAHRRTTPPQGPPPSGNGQREHAEPSQSSPRHKGQDRSEVRPPSHSPRAESEPSEKGESLVGECEPPVVLAPADPHRITIMRPRKAASRRRAPAGGLGGRPVRDRRGVFVRAENPAGAVNDPALVATLRAAAPWQSLRGRTNEYPLVLKPGDLRNKVRVRPAQHLVLFVVDASRSMGARERMRLTKAAALSLLVDAYQKRDRVGLITFGGAGAQLALAPTRSVRVAARQLAELPVGGATPLAAGLALAQSVIATTRRKEVGVMPLVILLTDGRGNVPLRHDGQPLAEALALVRQLERDDVRAIVIDTETGPVRLGQAALLASEWHAQLLPLDDLRGSQLSASVRRALFARAAS